MGRREEGPSEWSHCPAAAGAQTFPYVVALPPGAGAAPWGLLDTPWVIAATQAAEAGPLPNGISAPSCGPDKEERAPALFFVPWSESYLPPERKWPLLLSQTLTLPNFPCICGKVSLRAEVQAETSGLMEEGEEG